MHITITGRLGSGKTTVCRILSDKYGYEIYSTGKINRAIAAEKGITALEMNELMAKDLSFDHMIDNAVSRISREMRDRTLIFDSRMAWHFACDSFKVFMHIDPAIAAKRVMADDRGAVEKYTDADDARRQLLARATAENTRYRRIYGATITPEALAALILSEFELYRSSPAEYGSPKLMLSPLSIYPTATVGEMEREDGPITVAVMNGSHYAVGGGRALLAAMKEKPQTVRAYLADGAGSAAAEKRAAAIAGDGEALLRSLEKEFGFSYPEIPEIYRRKA